MAKTTKEYRQALVRALRAVNRYSPSVDPQLISLAGALRTVDMANEEIDRLESTTIPVTSRYGNDTIAPHPVFKILAEAQDRVTKQMKALGLTTAELTGTDDNDPLIELTEQVKKTGVDKAKTIRRKA